MAEKLPGESAPIKDRIKAVQGPNCANDEADQSPNSVKEPEVGIHLLGGYLKLNVRGAAAMVVAYSVGLALAGAILLAALANFG